MKVLHIMPDLPVAGAESLLVNILKNMNRTIFDIHLCVLYSPYDTWLDRELKEFHIPLYYLGKRRGVDTRMISRIHRVLSEVKPDVVHTHRYVMRYTLLPTLFNRIPVKVHTVHNIAQREVDLGGKIIHWFAFNLFRVIPVSVSDGVAASVYELYGVRSPTIYNGIPIGSFITLKQPSEETDTTFINVSGFRPQKNHHLLIEAFAEVVKVRRGSKLFLVGDGPLRCEIEKLVDERKMRNNVFFLGVRDDIPALLENTDIYVSASKWEGLSLSMIEAMAAGKPIIATAAAGVIELFQGSNIGILVPSNAPRELGLAMLELASNPHLRREMGEKARIRAASKFDIKMTVKNYEKLYTNLNRRYATQAEGI